MAEKLGRLVVYTDGSCPFCKWSRQKVERYDGEGRVGFRDYNDPAAARETPYSDAELAAEMHVLAPDGRWYGNAMRGTTLVTVSVDRAGRVSTQ